MTPVTKIKMKGSARQQPAHKAKGRAKGNGKANSRLQQKAQAQTGSTETGSLEKRLAAHNSFFNDVVCLIPPKHYLSDAVEENHARIAAKYMKNAKNEAPKQAIKESSKKAKRAKGFGKTVLELQEEEQQREAAHNENGSAAHSKKGAKAKGKGGKQKATRTHTNEDADDNPRKKPFLVAEPNNLSPLELRAKLAAKLQELKQTRNAKIEPKEREKVTKKRSKLKQQREKKAMVKATRPDAAGVAPGKTKAQNTEDADAQAAPVTFSKFEFAEDAQSNLRKKARPNPKQRLQMVERERDELEQLRKADAKKAAEVETDKGWEKALKRAEGEKVFDNPQLVKKTIKARERAKKKSKKEWEERVSMVEKEQKMRQEKRERNLKTRIDARKQRKLKKLQKKRPGFEGK